MTTLFPFDTSQKPSEIKGVFGASSFTNTSTVSMILGCLERASTDLFLIAHDVTESASSPAWRTALCNITSFIVASSGDNAISISIFILVLPMSPSMCDPSHAEWKL